MPSVASENLIRQSCSVCAKRPAKVNPLSFAREMERRNDAMSDLNEARALTRVSSPQPDPLSRFREERNADRRQ
jgi:hypothetical protein